MRLEELKKTLCSTFCGSVTVTPLASGYAISSAFKGASGDRISFYLTPSEDGYLIEDDGSYLAHLIAKDIPIDQGQRGQLLEGILSTANAYWDRETLEIRTSTLSEKDVARRVIDFLSGMIRVRDLELLTREALLLKLEAERLNRTDFEVIALVEEPEMRLISHKRFQRAQNRDIAMPIFREDEDAAMAYVRRRLRFPEGHSTVAGHA